MLYWALAFFIVSVVAAVFGFSGIAIASAEIARMLFFVFVVLFVIFLLTGLAKKPHTDRAHRRSGARDAGRRKRTGGNTE